MTTLNRRASRPAARSLRFLAALMMALGLTLGGLSAPALAADVTGQNPATGQDQSTPTQDQPGPDSGAEHQSVQNRMAAQAVTSEDPLDDDCPGLGDMDLEPSVPGCQKAPCALNPDQENCSPPPSEQCSPNEVLVGGVCVPDVPCSVSGTCGGDDGGNDDGGTPPDDDDNDLPPTPATPPSTDGPKNHQAGPHHGSHGHSSSLGTSTGSAEGTVPGSSSPASSVTSCDPTICSSIGATNAAPAPSTGTAQGATQGGRKTLGNTGAPTDSTQLLLLGLGLLGGGFLLVRRPRAAAVAAGAHRRDRD